MLHKCIGLYIKLLYQNRSICPGVVKFNTYIQKVFAFKDELFVHHILIAPAIHLKIVIICLFIERQNNEEITPSSPSSHPKAMLNLIGSLHDFVTDFSFLFINLILF